MTGFKLLLAVFYRLKGHYIIASIALITTIVSILGAFTVLANINNYIIYKTTAKVPIHITFTVASYADNYKALDYSIDKVLEYYSKVYGEPEVKDHSIILTYTIVSPFETHILSQESNITTKYITIGSINGSPLDINVTQGTRNGKGIGISSRIARKLNISIGDRIRIVINDTTTRHVAYNVTLPVEWIYEYKESTYPGIGSTSSQTASVNEFVTGSFPGYADIFVNKSILITVVSKTYNILANVNKQNVYVILNIVFREEYLVLYNPDIAYENVDKFIDNKLRSISKGVFGKDIVPRKISLFFIQTRSQTRVEIETPYGNSTLMASMEPRIQDMISSLKSITQFQLISLLVTASLPMFIGSWYLLIVVSGIVVYGLRRHLALLLTRGIPSDKLKKSFTLLLFIVAIISIVIAIPLSSLAAETIVPLVLDKLYYTPPLLDPFTIIVSVMLGILMAMFVYWKSRRYIEVESGELSFVTRIYLPGEREVWRPGTFLTILFIISVIKYVLWLAGLSTADMMRYAMETRSMGFVIVITIYSIIDSVAAFIAPYVLTYFLVQYFTHSPAIVNVFSKAVTKLVSGNLSDSVRGLISRGSARLYKASFVIALVFAVTLNYLGLSSSLGRWYSSVSDKLETVLGGYTAIQEFTIEGQMYASKLMVYYGIILALLSSILMALVLTRELEKEVIILRARGAGVRDVLKIVYGVLFTIVSISLVSGFISGIIWLRGEIDGFNDNMQLSPTVLNTTSTQIPFVELTYTYTDVIYILVLIALLLIAPLIIVFTHISKPVAEKLRRIT